MSNHCEPEIKSRHTFIDFLYFKLLTAVPLVTVLAGFLKTQPIIIFPYLVWIALHMSLVYRLLCTHCPHYGAYGGKTRCLYLWNVPPVYKTRPGKQTVYEKICVNSLLGVSILFPVPWLMQQFELLVIYMLSIAVLLITMMRYECIRCAHLSCSHNKSKGSRTT
jgi:hypothetical protein